MTWVRTRKRALLAVALAGILALVGLAVVGPARADKSNLTVTFADTAGLFVGNDVGILGVPVGRVKSIDPDGAVSRVVLEIEHGVKVPAGAWALIVSRSVATDRYVELTPRYTSGPVLSSGTTIPVERTKTPVDFDEVLDSVHDLATGISGSGPTRQAMSRFLKASADTFGPHGADMNAAIINLSTAVDGIYGQRDNLSGTVTELDTLAEVLVRNKGAVEGFLDSMASTTEMLAAERTNFERAVTKLRKAVMVLSDFAQRNADAIRVAARDASGVADTLLAHKSSVAEFLRVMPIAVENIANARGPEGFRLQFPIGNAFQNQLKSLLCGAVPLPGLCAVIGAVPFEDFFNALFDNLHGLGGK
ncbi:MAG: MlaD family protein [Propionibacteriales bacterium]|nr:MlaD family protein [Propionibacteriales bacterium]